MVMNQLMEIVFSPLIDNKHRLSLSLLLAFLLGEFLLLHLNMIFVG